MKQSPSWEANSHSAPQEIPRILKNPKVHYRIHHSPPLVPSWSRWILSTYFHSIILRSISILSFHPRPCLPCGLFTPCFPTRSLCAFVISPMRAACPAISSSLILITLRIFGTCFDEWRVLYDLFLQLAALCTLTCPIQWLVSPQ
jgi:hypothetical protein